MTTSRSKKQLITGILFIILLFLLFVDFSSGIKPIILILIFFLLLYFAKLSNPAIDFNAISAAMLAEKKKELGDENYKKYLKKIRGRLEADIISEAEKGKPRNALLEEKLILIEEEIKK